MKKEYLESNFIFHLTSILLDSFNINLPTQENVEFVVSTYSIFRQIKLTLTICKSILLLSNCNFGKKIMDTVTIFKFNLKQTMNCSEMKETVYIFCR